MGQLQKLYIGGSEKGVENEREKWWGYNVENGITKHEIENQCGGNGIPRIFFW